MVDDDVHDCHKYQLVSHGYMIVINPWLSLLLSPRTLLFMDIHSYPWLITMVLVIHGYPWLTIMYIGVCGW